MAIESVDDPALQRAVEELIRQSDDSKGVLYVSRESTTLEDHTWFTIDGDVDLVKLVNAILG